MNKKILYEIYRQQQLMGVDKKILKENKYVELGSDLIKSFFNTSKKAIKDVVDDVMVGSVRVSKQVLNDIMDVLDDPSLYEALSKGEKEIFGRLVSQNQGLVDDIYEQLMSEVMTSTNKSEKGLVEFISNRIKDGQKISDVLTNLNGEEDAFLNEVLIQKLSQKIRDLKTNKFVTEVESKEIKKFIDPTTGKVWEAPEYVAQIDRELSKFQKILKQSGISAATKWLKDAVKVYEPFFVQYIRNWYANLIFNWKNVQLKNINKAKEFINNAYKLQSEGKDGDAVRELQKALSMILISKKDPGYNVDVIINAFIKDNPNLSEITKELFLNSKAAGNKTIKDFISEIADNTHEQLIKPINTELKSFAEMIPGVSAFMKKDLNLVNSAKDLITTPVRRWFNLITWKDARSAYEIILGMSKRGVNKEVSARIASYLLANVLIIPALISLVKTWGEQIESSAKSTYLEALKKLCDEKILTSGCTEVNQELNNIKFMFGEDYVKNYLKNLPIDLGKMFGNESWDSDTAINKNIFFMTYWDDLINGLYNIIQGSPFPFIGKPKANKLLKILEDKNSEAYKELVKLGINPKAEDLEKEIINYYKTHTSPEDRAKVDEVINQVEKKKNEVVQDINDSELGFKAWCLKNGKTFVDYDENTHIGKTNEPMDYEWNGTNFVPY
jgi:hypothetical protein